MSKLTNALLKAEFLDVTGFEERLVDKVRRVSINIESKMAFTIVKNIVCIIDGNGHTWIRPNLFRSESEEKQVRLIEKLVASNKECNVPFAKDSNRFLRQVWPHLFD